MIALPLPTHCGLLLPLPGDAQEFGQADVAHFVRKATHQTKAEKIHLVVLGVVVAVAIDG